MSELGRLLLEARNAKELSLADVEKTTRIRQKYLEALENGQFSSLPRGATARGFLRTYASFLGLDVAEVSQLYARESGDSGEDVSIAEPGKPRLVDYRPIEVELINEERSWGWLRWLVALVIVAALAGAGWWYLSRNPGRNLLTSLGSPSPAVLAQRGATASPTTTATPWIVTATAPADASGAQLRPTPTSDLLPLPTPTLPPTPTPSPRPTGILTPEAVTRIALAMRIGQRAWVHVAVDGSTTLEEILETGQTRSWEANSSVYVRTGNAGGVNLTLNNQDLGVMGDVGQVAERVWVVTQGTVTEATPGTPTSMPPPTGTATPSG